MNKTAIKNFAVWARNKLIADITYKAGLLGVTAKEIKSPLMQSTQTVQFFEIGTKEPYSITGVEIEQRKKLVEEIQSKVNQNDYETAYKNVVEEVAYTWFNRLIAVRFMEVNDYLPTHIRVLSSESSSKSEPDLVTHPLDTDLNYTAYEKDRIIQLKNDNKLDELFRMLFIKQCNILNRILPDLFEKINDYTELLLNISFTDQDGIVYHLINDISEDDFNVSKEGQVEILGWMYQYYNTEPKSLVDAYVKDGKKVAKEDLPAKTQLFTPDWIVRYMVENSLGHLWMDGHPYDTLKTEWRYYLDEAKQETIALTQLNIIREEYKKIKPDEITIIDPCMGSGHILVYAFDILMQIYESYGYSQRDAAKSIIEKNLYGLDIDDRASQLAYFAVLMKGRQYNRHIFNDKIDSHIFSIKESNFINRSHLCYFGADLNINERNQAMEQMKYLLDTFIDAKEYGSILTVKPLNWLLLSRFVGENNLGEQVSLEAIGLDKSKIQLSNLVTIGSVMAHRYNICITNPPYMGSSCMSSKLSEFVKKEYPDSKFDLFSVFIEKGIQMSKINGFNCMVTMQSWMFLTSFVVLRKKLIASKTISNLMHMDNMVMGIAFGTAVTVFRNSTIKNYIGTYNQVKFSDIQGDRPHEFPVVKNRFAQISAENFAKIPEMPIAYWVSEKMRGVFEKSAPLKSICEPRQGMATTNNALFLRLWYETNYKKIGFGIRSEEESAESNLKWFPYNKGGEFRRWYGNNDYIVNFQNHGKEVCDYIDNFSNSHVNHKGRVINREYYFKESITWSFVSSSYFGARYCTEGFIFDIGGSSAFPSHNNIYYMTGFLCSKLSFEYMKIQNPTLNFQVGNVATLPIIVSENDRPHIEDLVQNCITISKNDWDSFETSWDFTMHPLLKYRDESLKIENSFNYWKCQTEKQFNNLKANEEELNRIFIRIYCLQDDMNSEVEDKHITISKSDLVRDVRSFISYAVGCIFGRYSLDVDGLAYAGGEWDDSKYSTHIPDIDNVLPVTDEEYFEDDIVGLFCAFVKNAFGERTLEANLDFIAQALGNKGTSSRETIRKYFLNDFFKDHSNTYSVVGSGKRPIYWLFDSGKANGFKALVYMHRYDENTIGNMRVDYLHKIQRVYENEISRMQESIDNSKDAREISIAIKRKEKLVKQLKETKEFDEKIAHLALARIKIDLDDGVKVNYEKVQTGTDGKKLEVLAKI